MVAVLSILALVVLVVAVASAGSDAIAHGFRRRRAGRPLRAEDSLHDPRRGAVAGNDAASARLYDLKRYDQSGLGGL